jgi:hypothetical protein
MIDLKPLSIVDDRRCALGGELYRECDCFDDTPPFADVCTCNTVWSVSFPCSIHGQAAVPSTGPAPEIPAPTTAQPETNRRSGPKGKANR